mmetsp:Transcript_39509/g.108862  ORF Transcript_39509/g.108862 Transcript_39509/m.108862 type:complete len:215 (-) Transcript_39509:301-945(-)
MRACVLHGVLAFDDQSEQQVWYVQATAHIQRRASFGARIQECPFAGGPHRCRVCAEPAAAQVWDEVGPHCLDFATDQGGRCFCQVYRLLPVAVLVAEHRSRVQGFRHRSRAITGHCIRTDSHHCNFQRRRVGCRRAAVIPGQQRQRHEFNVRESRSFRAPHERRDAGAGRRLRIASHRSRPPLGAATRRGAHLAFLHVWHRRGRDYAEASEGNL